MLRDRELKVFRHDSDDRRRLAVYSDRLPDDVRVAAKIASPNFIAENRRFLRARLVVLRREIAAHDRRHADDSEKILGDVSAGVALGIILVGNVDRRSVQIAGHQGEGLLAGLQVLVVLRGGNVAISKVILLRCCLRIDQADARELFRVRERKAAQNKGIHDRELGRDAGNAEGENQDREQTK